MRTGSIALSMQAGKQARPTRARRGRKQASGHDRVLSAAYDLFLRRGVRGVGVDDIVAAAGVAKATFYRHFGSKDDLIVAFLRSRQERWTVRWLEAEVLRRETSPRRRLLVVFDLFDEWFHGRDFEGCPFVGAVAQAVEPSDRVRHEAMDQLAAVRSFLRGLAGEAGVKDPEAFAHSWHLLMLGSIVMALTGDLRAAQRARATAEVLLQQAG